MSWLRRLVQKRRLETELGNEIRDHLERQVADYKRSGLTEEEARRKAQAAFVVLSRFVKKCRE